MNAHQKTLVWRARVWRWHRWTGTVAGLMLLIWLITGLMHPWMSRVQPKPWASPLTSSTEPRTFFDLRQAVPLGTVLDRQWRAAVGADRDADAQALGRVRQVSLAQWTEDGTPVQAYRVAWQHSVLGTRYYRLSDGAWMEHGEQRHVAALTRTLVGEGRIVAVSLVSQFDTVYGSVNRFLPVWRVDIDRGMIDHPKDRAAAERVTAFVDPATGRLVTLTNTKRTRLETWFAWGHRWDFVNNHPNLRVLLMSLGLLGVLFLSVSGLYFYVGVKPRPHMSGVRRWHRRVGGVLSGFLLSVALSGAWHLWQGRLGGTIRAGAAPGNWSVADWHALTTPPVWAALIQQPWSQLGWLAVSDPHDVKRPETKPAWVLAPVAPAQQDRPHHPHAASGHVPQRGALDAWQIIDTKGQPLAWQATALAISRQWLTVQGRPVPQVVPIVTWLSKFDHDYGFINKRLPVACVDWVKQGGPWHCIDLRTGSLALSMDRGQRWEGWSFSNLHKWHFIADRDWRDGLQGLLVVGLMVLTLLGFALFWSRRRA